jgi:hypothetical protein
MEKVTGIFCPNGPKGASHKRCLSPFPENVFFTLERTELMSKVTRLPCYLACLAVLLTVAGGTTARAEKLLRWKFTEGEELHFVTHTKMTNKSMIGEMPMTMTMNQIIDLGVTVNSVDADGTASITHEMKRIRVKAESAQGINIDYDSASEEEPQGVATMMVPMFEAMLNKPVPMKISPRGVVSDVEVPQALVDGLNKTPAGQMVGGVFSEDSLKDMFKIGTLPEEAVSPGDTWTEEAEVTMPMFGKAKTGQKHEYLGTETRDGRELEKIKITMTMQIEPGGEETAMRMKVTEQENTGTAYFDCEAGRFAGNEMTMKMKMEVGVDKMNIPSEVEVESRTTLESADSSEE